MNAFAPGREPVGGSFARAKALGPGMAIPFEYALAIVIDGIRRMTSQQQKSLVAHIAAIVSAGEPSNVTSAHPLRVAPVPVAPASDARPRSQQSRAGASGWTPERKARMSALQTARHAAKRQERKASEGGPLYAESKAPSKAALYASRAVSGSSSLSGSSGKEEKTEIPPPLSSSLETREKGKAEAALPAPKARTEELRQKEEEEEKAIEGWEIPNPEASPSCCPRDPSWHQAAYTDGIRAIDGLDHWTLDRIGERESVDALAGYVWTRFLVDATEAEARAWYAEQTGRYVRFQRNRDTGSHITLYRPSHFRGWLERFAGHVPKAKKPPRKAAPVATKRAPEPLATPEDIERSRSVWEATEPELGPSPPRLGSTARPVVVHRSAPAWAKTEAKP